jgi:predicted nucleic acid-binding protein
MRLALDTNILAYAEGVNGAAKKKVTLELIDKLSREEIFVPVQVLGELFHVLTRKAGRTFERARDALLSWHDAYPTIETSGPVLTAAIDLAAHHRLGIWDSVVLAGASAAGCRLMLSEDLQAGFTWAGVTVVNPYAAVKHDLLEALLESRA